MQGWIQARVIAPTLHVAAGFLALVKAECVRGQRKDRQELKVWACLAEMLDINVGSPPS